MDEAQIISPDNQEVVTQTKDKWRFQRVLLDRRGYAVLTIECGEQQDGDFIVHEVQTIELREDDWQTFKDAAAFGGFVTLCRQAARQRGNI